MSEPLPAISVILPTYRRGEILLQTLWHLKNQDLPPAEILVIDQTREHPAFVGKELSHLETSGFIRWIRLDRPSIPAAMNAGLRAAMSPIALFLDDDIEPSLNLVRAHAVRHGGDFAAVCGQVLQPGEVPDPAANRWTRREGLRADLDFRFNGTVPSEIANVMAGNLSVLREPALSIGGFDEQFIGSAYRFETDFARRLIAAGHRILFAPEASVRHLRLPTGGTRSLGDHLARPAPGHAVGDYLFALRHARGGECLRYVARRLVRETCNRYGLRHPWKLPVKLAAEIRALAWARRLDREGPRLLET